MSFTSRVDRRSGLSLPSFQTGSVGIGTTNPIAALHVVGTNPSTGFALRIEQGSPAGDGLLAYVNTTSEARTVFTATSNATGLKVRGDGAVAVGLATPISKLHVQNGPTTGLWTYAVDGITGECNGFGCTAVRGLSAFSFDWKENGAHDIGFIAEEVGQVVPEIVTYEENGKDAKALDYARLTPLLVEAVKELKKENEALKSRIDQLENERKVGR